MKSYNFKDEIKKQIKESADLKQEIIKTHTNSINDIANEIISAVENKNKIIWFGNGGSAADAQHLSCELISKFIIDREPISSIAITTNTSILTAISNDYDFEKIFERQIKALAQKGDILVGISTSGTSPNIIKGLETGKKMGTINISFTGKNTSAVKDISDFIIDIPSDSTPRIQEIHITIGHIICDLVEKTLFGE